MKKLILVAIILFNFIQCSAIRQKFLEIEKKDRERYDKFRSGERPLYEVDFYGYVENMVYYFDNYLDDVAIKYINWYPEYHSQLLSSLNLGSIIELFQKKSKAADKRYNEFVNWYRNLKE